MIHQMTRLGIKFVKWLTSLVKLSIPESIFKLAKLVKRLRMKKNCSVLVSWLIVLAKIENFFFLPAYWRAKLVRKTSPATLHRGRCKSRGMMMLSLPPFLLNCVLTCIWLFCLISEILQHAIKDTFNLQYFFGTRN